MFIFINYSRKSESVKIETSAVVSKAPPMKCRECKQLLDDPDLLMFPGDADDAVSSRWDNNNNIKLVNLAFNIPENVSTGW